MRPWRRSGTRSAHLRPTIRVPDPERGIRELVVGTGGKSLARRRWNAPNSEVRRSATAGILQVTLRAGEYSWRFVTAPGGRVGDSGTSDCH